MEFYFLDKSKIQLTDYPYQDFDKMVNGFGYQQATNIDLHNYFDWSKIDHWQFKYDLYDEFELCKVFKATPICDISISFIIRLQQHQPLIKVNAIDLAGMLDDLNYEVGMGWEGISECGKYIIEFTDKYQHNAISNFEILPNTKAGIIS